MAADSGQTEPCMSTDHSRAVSDIASQLTALSRRGKRPRVYRGGSNSTRPAPHAETELVDLNGLNRVLAIDEDRCEALVEPNVSMERLVAATLERGYLPPVVMEFPGITVGGGVAGGAGESSSFTHGLFHRCVSEYEVVLGDGELVTASPTAHEPLYHALPGSCGSLGILTAARLRLRPAYPFVKLTYYRVGSFAEAVAQLSELCLGSGGGELDFVDAIMFSPERGVVMVGTSTAAPGSPVRRFRRARDEWFYLHAERVSRRHSRYTEYVPIRDYFFRYDRGAFWTGKQAFVVTGVPFNRATRFMLNAFLNTETLYTALHGSNLSYRYLVQDIYLPRQRAEEFLQWVSSRLKITPLWLWPVRPDERSLFSPACLSTDLVIDVGVWGVPALEFYQANREIEQRTLELAGRKMLYAHLYQPEEEFWRAYDRTRYLELRRRYRAEQAFPSLFEKVRTRYPDPLKTSVPAGAKEVFKSKLVRA